MNASAKVSPVHGLRGENLSIATSPTSKSEPQVHPLTLHSSPTSKSDPQVHPLTLHSPSWSGQQIGDDIEHKQNSPAHAGSHATLRHSQTTSPIDTYEDHKRALATSISAGARAHMSKAPNCRARLWECVDTPSSGTLAQAFSIVIMALILISVITFCMETLPEFHKKTPLIWFGIETVCIVIFTIEFILRIASAPNTCKFLYNMYTIIDILAIFPYYMELVVDLIAKLTNQEGQLLINGAFLRVFRLLRVLRVFKMARYLSWMKLFTISFRQSLPPLGMFLFFVTIVITVFACFIYYLERGEYMTIDGEDLYVQHGEPSKFNSIPNAMYWCVITMTTVGYGDMYPQTVPGMLVAAAASLTGIFVLAIPITIISSNFNREYEREKKERAEAHAKMMMIRNHFRRRKSGFSTLADEIENMVTHNTVRYKKKVINMIDASRSELIDEIQEIVRLAYDTRLKTNDMSEGEAMATLKRRTTT